MISLKTDIKNTINCCCFILKHLLTLYYCKHRWDSFIDVCWDALVFFCVVAMVFIFCFLSM